MASNTRAIALLSFVWVLACVPETRAGGQWFAAGSETAVVISHDSSAAVRLLVTLTTAQAVMQPLVPINSQLPIRVMAVDSETQLRELVPQYWERRGVRPNGASYPAPHAAFIALRTNIPVAQQFPLLTHEYVHLLTASAVPDASAWLDEGLAEFWGALALDGEQPVIGRAPQHHLKLLRTRAWLSPDQMQHHRRGKLAAERADALMFYAQSWAMVHYLLLGRDSTAPLAFAPFERQWTPELDIAVRAYVAAGRFREVVMRSTDIPKVAPGSSPSLPQRISEARSLAERANMVVFGERPDAALPLVRRALALDSRQPLALEVMGTYYFLRNQPEQAREWLSQALDADRGSYTVPLYLALLSPSAAERERHLVAAVTAKPDLVVGWQRLWTLYVEDGRAEQARQWCERAAALVGPWWWVEQPLRCGGQERQ